MPNQCTCTCCSHGIVSLDDRLAAWASGRQHGHVEAQLDQLRQEARALELADELVGWIATRIHARAEHGPNWADEVAGPMPGGGRR